MNRAERRAAEAAQAASEAGRVLQAAGQETVDDAPQQVSPKLDDTRQKMMEGLYEGRKKAAQKIVDPADMPPGLPPEEPQEPTDEEREAEEARKATKLREDAAKKQQKADEDKKVAAPKEEPVVPRETVVVEPAEVPTTSKQKVDGVEYDVPLAEIEEAGSEKAWRLNKAAENRLAKANEATAQAKQAQAQIAAWMQANAPKQDPKPTADEALRNLAANRFGTDEEFANNLKAALGVMVPQIDQNAVILQATASIKRDNASAKFNKDFSDVLANPVIKKVALQLESEALSPYVVNGQVNWGGLAQLDWDTVYSTIGVQLKGAVGPRPSQPAAAQASASGIPSLSEREARKASIVNLPQAAAARAVAPAEEKPETREEALNRMRKSRGIPTG